MGSKTAGSTSATGAGSGTEEVEAFLAALEHPRKQELIELRQLILAADPSIAEGIKWKVPSFRTSEYFATFHLRAKEGLQVILHLGAKLRESAVAGIAIDDPQALLKWLAKDRAAATFRDREELEARRAAFTQIIRQWITYL